MEPKDASTLDGGATKTSLDSSRERTVLDALNSCFLLWEKGFT